MSEQRADETTVAEFKELMATPAARQAFVELKRAKEDRTVGMRYQHVFKAVFGTPWALYEPYMELIANLLVDRAMDVRMDSEELAERLESARRPARPPAPQGVAVVPLHGVIVPKASMFSDMSGGTSVEGFRSMFREAMGTKEVGAIVLDVDSPGGSVEGIPEMAGELRSARGTKPIVAVANGMMASAAYWLASQADEIVATKSALVGSIGVKVAHEDMSKAAGAKGLKVSLISAGKFKTEGNRWEPLSDEARAHVQALVDEFYGMFVSDVAKGRRVSVEDVRSGFGEGRAVSASAGLSAGMVDRIGSLEGVVGEQLAASSKPGALQGEFEAQAAVMRVALAEDFVAPDPEPKAAPVSTAVEAFSGSTSTTSDLMVRLGVKADGDPDLEPEPAPEPELSGTRRQGLDPQIALLREDPSLSSLFE